MPPAERRAAIVAATLPLVLQHGAGVSTRQVAEAAGIAEGTIFRVFADKDELLDACIAEVLRPEGVLDALATIPLDQPLADRLVEAAGALEAHLGRIRDVVGGLHGRAARPLRRPDAAAGLDRDASTAATTEAVTALFEPDADALRLPAAQLAGLFLGQLWGRGRPVGGPQLPAEQLVDLFLHGAMGPREGAA